VVDAFLRRNRDPAWIKAGDVSTQGLAYGTNLLRACGVWSLDVSRYSRVPVTIEMTDGEPRLTYEAIGIELTVLEANGAMATGWLQYNGSWYYLNA
ncbi:hypothetical protein ACLNB0_10330, partial [Streptococcus pneumoniae]